MRNVFYEPGARRAEKVGDLFAAVAPRYDLINDLQSLGLHRLWKRRLVRLAQPARGKKALDVCCGTGDAAFRLARAGAEVTAMDFSGAMLEAAVRRGRNWEVEAPAPVFLRADALRVPFPDDVFDLVTVSYGLRNLASLDAGLEELWRVLKPGGRFLALDFGKPPNRLWRAVYFGYLRRVVPLFGRLFCGSAETHAYILESLLNYPAQEGVRQRLLDLRARDCRVINLLGGAMSIHTAVKPE